jgi:hypothetical protein
MQIEMDILLEIPCFKCLFGELLQESSVDCNPNECQKLTEWLLKEAEKHRQTEERS